MTDGWLDDEADPTVESDSKADLCVKAGEGAGVLAHESVDDKVEPKVESGAKANLCVIAGEEAGVLAAESVGDNSVAPFKKPMADSKLGKDL